MITPPPIIPYNIKPNTGQGDEKWYYLPLALLFVFGMALMLVFTLFFLISVFMNWFEGKTLLEAFMNNVYFIGEMFERLY